MRRRNSLVLLLFPGFIRLNRRFLGKALLLAFLASTSAFQNMAARTLIRTSLHMLTSNYHIAESKLCTVCSWSRTPGPLLVRLHGSVASVDEKSNTPKKPRRKRQSRSYDNTSTKKKSFDPQRAASVVDELSPANGTLDMIGAQKDELLERLLNMTLKQLRREVKALGLKVSGNKNTLISRIFDSYEEHNLLNDTTPDSTPHTPRKKTRHYNPGSRNPDGVFLYQNGARVKEQNPEHVAVCDPKKTYILRARGLNKESYASSVGIQFFEAAATTDYDGNLTENFEIDGYHEGYLFFNATCTPFEVEYLAVLAGLRYAYCLGARRINLQLSHSVIHHQIQGKFPVTRSSLKKYYWTLQRMLEIDMQLDFFETNLMPATTLGRARQLATVGLATGESSLDGIFNLDIVLDSMKNVTDVMSPADAVNEDVKEVAVDAAPVALSEVKTPGPSKAKLEKEASVKIDSAGTYLLQFDGGCRGNPDGIAGVGLVIYDNAQTEEIWCGYKYLSKDKSQKTGMTNNQSEYMGLILVLEKALQLGIKHVVVQGDSDLVVKQMQGRYKVRDAKLKALYEKAVFDAKQFDSFKIEHIPRKLNARADYLANHAMDYRSDSFD